MAVIISALLIYVGCIVFIRIRNAEPFGLKRQLTDFSTFMVPFNIPAYLLSKIPTTPQIDKAHLPELKLIDDNWETIRDEALALYTGGNITAKDDLPASSFYKDGRWTSFYLKVYDNKLPSAYELAPKTMALLDQMPTMNIALFAVLMPGKKLNRHHDPFAYTVRYSLGLSTPNDEGCGLTINEDDYIWRDGESVVFDETYIHSAWNNTDKPRIILMTDVDRPLKSKLVQKIYWSFGWFFNRLFFIDNLDPTHTGVGNKIGKGVLAYKHFLKSVKRRNKTFYVVAKWAVILGILYAIGASLV
ncbi:MAG: aspartyl/asparaginyl beta-hydroxylase domain-containing protein [Pseudomonadota bacterium]|jgi:beta-hydroxylase|uniref:aspartyl/asparaginyl beta-hydroxylase domain-containing protein n=1 Tax=Alcanivorax sp. TaxID=1872427 RepID=UPI0025C31FD4|nr:aspartyl/asparaginyl beta-hydroxylase domain-containing protein [Alcanivorax sp.]MED5238612.1 aspartyl/asparaginyl beta-hydroxylase domain-containing protein [Pseudomonadota bacterium]MEE3320467.1 aspartyl/asparaginyl beta-hydroxylase domain-containing protein [Pseudomonadota bacterium]